MRFETIKTGEAEMPGKQGIPTFTSELIKDPAGYSLGQRLGAVSNNHRANLNEGIVEG